MAVKVTGCRSWYVMYIVSTVGRVYTAVMLGWRIYKDIRIGGNIERWKGKKAGREKDVKEKGRKVEKYGKVEKAERQKGGKVKRWKGRKMESMKVEKVER
jgi:hypothetical protein